MPIELMTIVCDLCRKNPIVDTVKIKMEWKGICKECLEKERNEN
jgi:hypothetical protein